MLRFFLHTWFNRKFRRRLQPENSMCALYHPGLHFRIAKWTFHILIHLILMRFLCLGITSNFIPSKFAFYQSARFNSRFRAACKTAEKFIPAFYRCSSMLFHETLYAFDAPIYFSSALTRKYTIFALFFRVPSHFLRFTDKQIETTDKIILIPKRI